MADVEPVEKVQIPDFLKNFLAIDQRVTSLKFFQDGVFLQTRYWVFLMLTTDTGIEGYGEAYAVPFHMCSAFR